MRLRHFLTFTCVPALLIACQTTPELSEQAPALKQASSEPLCENKMAEIRAAHKTARVNGCDVMSSTAFAFTITPEEKTDPEGKKINNSPWYGFRVDPKGRKEKTLRIRLNYENGDHRYPPKISYDGQYWEFLPPTRVTEIESDKVDITLKLDNRPFFISAQEIFTPAAHKLWAEKLAEKSFVTQTIIGESKEGRPLYMIEAATETDKKKPYVVLVGRQHPPEVTGALALMPFTEQILSQDELSERFLEHFNLLVIPMINPDGVLAGNWRFNMGGMDLNRDWGPFSQPETQAVKAAFERFENVEDDIIFFLDFHSTGRNLLYTQADDEPTYPPMFTKQWLEAVDEKLDDDVYSFTREARHNSGRPISKNYMYDTYGIPAITYEVGDDTPRKAIDISARVFAEEMMKLLIEHETAE